MLDLPALGQMNIGLLLLEYIIFLELLLATLHGQVLSLIQTVLQVLNSNFQVLLHPLQYHQLRSGSEPGQTQASSWCSEGLCSM
uniref:Si:ch211-158m24.12 n=1 Tax=Cynoglossus semilaevis TaxID=244447 RepID=A0A3P8X1K8_CYNSE